MAAVIIVTDGKRSMFIRRTWDEPKKGKPTTASFARAKRFKLSRAKDIIELVNQHSYNYAAFAWELSK